MAKRIARSGTLSTAPKTARSKSKKSSLDAFAKAHKLVSEKTIAKHRLGEDLDDEPKHKRRRKDNDEENSEDEQDEFRHKRSSRQSEIDPDNDLEYGSDSDGNEWTMGGIAEGNNDSDLDSDQAFASSDEEHFEGFAFRGSSANKDKTKKRGNASMRGQRNGQSILIEEDEENDQDSGDSADEEGLGLGDEAVDLAAMLNDDDEKVSLGPDSMRKEIGEDSETDGEDDDDNSLESELEVDEDDDITNEVAIARNRDRVDALNLANRQAATTRSEAAVTLDDFEEDIGLVLEDAAIKSIKKKQSKPTTIAAPLPRRQQDRLNREVASGKTKIELEKWVPGTKQIRRAEHLTFPLQHPDDQGITLGKQRFLHSNESAYQTELEESIQRIMEESGLAVKHDRSGADENEDEESTLLKAEELAIKNMPVEEVMQRRAELRRARELLFREEIKAKRLAKIKSKSHRRVMRKQKEKQREAMQALGDDSMDKDYDQEGADRRRAEARMNTKHKDSKWAKALKQTNRTAWDDNARDAAVEQAMRNEQLRKRIHGKDVYDEGENDSSPEERGESDGEIVLDRLDHLQTFETIEKKGLAGLKFMRAADERRRAANNEDIERLRKELAAEDDDEATSEAEESLGRASFGPLGREKGNNLETRRMFEFEAPVSSDSESQEDESTSIHNNLSKRNNAKKFGTGNSFEKPSVTNTLINKEPIASGKTVTNGWLKAPKGGARKADFNAGVNLDLRLTSRDSLQRRLLPDKSNNLTNDKVTQHEASGTVADESSTNPILMAQGQKKSLQQRAFAGDDVEASFAAEKMDIAVSEDEKEVSNHLPGWGSWTGGGLSKSIKKANKRAKHNPLFKTKVDGVRLADRKDAQLKNVIVSEKQDRKGRKYLAPTLPHEFDTKEQYERSRRVPMGPEWTTKEVHQRMTKPRVVVQTGVNIKPLERPIA